jgi:hypothetical protein
MQLFFRYRTQFRYSLISIIAARTAFEAGTFLLEDWLSLKPTPYQPPEVDFDSDVEVALPSMVRT